MSAVSETVPSQVHGWPWFWQFVRHELTSYPGRPALVGRMIIAATLVMIISMTFRLPEGAYGAIYALTISRESPRSTIAAVTTVAIAFVIAAAYEVIGAMFFLNEPLLRFVWVSVTFILMFYSLRALTNYTAGVRFGYLVVITTPLWDQQISAEAKVENTLWAVWTITLATVITALVELVYAEFHRGSDLIRPIAERLSSVEDLVFSYAQDGRIDKTTEKKITRLSMVGTSQLRRNLQRSVYSSHYREQMGAVLTLVTRVLDLAVNLVDFDIKPSDLDRKRMRSLAQAIAGIRSDLERGVVPRRTELHGEDSAQSAVPLMREMEATVSLIPEVFVGSQSLSAYAPSPSGDAPRPTFFRPDALSNIEHIKFGLKGGLAATLCYFIYNVLDWPGISTAVTTCLLTGLSTIGSSHQKQLLRISGALVGGVGLGIGAQVFILPHLDSIAGFTVLFLAVTFIAAWFATCSARLSYFGVQIAVAFYLINLQEFKIQTSLGVARDRVFGIFLGIFAMWVVFDQLWGAPAAVEMKRTFISNLRLLAQFAREPFSEDPGTAIKQSITLRETINTNLDRVRALADGVLLEFGPSREQNLALRNRIRQWQTQLRMLFITRIALSKYRMRLPGFELPETIWQAQREFDDELAKTLDTMADRFEGQPTARRGSGLEASFKNLEQTVQTFGLRDLHRVIPEQLKTFLTLSRRLEGLATSLDGEI
jgi:multidrug resistance protein MdtO